MPRKIWWLAGLWLLAGCSTVCWKKLYLEEHWRQDGWKTVHYEIINNYEIFIFSGQLDGQPSLMLFCSNVPYRQSWEKIIIRYSGAEIAQFTFVSKVNGQWIMDYSEETKRWQNADFNCLRDEKNLKELPVELKRKIQQALQFGDSKYAPPPPWRTYPTSTRLTN